METSASFEARSAPLPYPTVGVSDRRSAQEIAFNMTGCAFIHVAFHPSLLPRADRHSTVFEVATALGRGIFPYLDFLDGSQADRDRKLEAAREQRRNRQYRALDR